MSIDKEHDINFAAVRAAIEGGLSNLERDPVRGVRNMLDLGIYFSNTHRQRSLFETAQQMLGRRRSRYIQLVRRTVANVDPEMLKTVGINLGYFSWSQGAKVIRETEAECGFNVPWSFVLRLNDECADPLTVSEVRDVIKQGRALGAHCYWVALGKSRAGELREMLDMIGSFSDCAFILLLPAEMVTHELAQYTVRQHNAAICVRSGRDEVVRRAADAMREERLLYGLYCMYDDANYREITEGAMLDTAYQCGGQYVLLMHSPDCSAECRAKVHAYANGEKNSPEKPAFMVDFFADIATIDNIISSQPCYIEIESDGSVKASPWDAATGVNVRTHLLAQALKALVPRVQ